MKVHPGPKDPEVKIQHGPRLAGREGESPLQLAAQGAAAFAGSAAPRTARESVQAAVKQLGALGWGRASFYSAPTGRGRGKVTGGQGGSKPQGEGFLLVASSGVLRTEPGACGPAAAGPRLRPLLEEAVASGASSSQGCAAAAVRGGNGLDGVLVVEASPSADDEDSAGNSVSTAFSEALPEEASSLASAAQLWAAVLGQRLANLRLQAVKTTSEKALSAVVSVLDTVADNVNNSTTLAQVGKMIPNEVIRGGELMEMERASLWLYEDRTKELVLNDDSHVRVKAEGSLVGEAASSSTQILYVKNLQEDPRYDKSQERGTFKTRGTICVPVPGPAELACAVVQFSNMTSQGKECDYFDLVAAETLGQSVLSPMLSIRESLMDMLEVERRREGVASVVARISAAQSVTEVAELLESQIITALDCQRCTFFFVDDRKQEIWAPPTSSRADGLWLPYGEGVVGHVAKMAIENPDQVDVVLITNDPAKSPFWKGPLTDLKVDNMMTAPVMTRGSERRLLGVLQILNKRDTPETNRRLSKKHSSRDDLSESDLSLTSGFTASDGKLLESLAEAVGSHLELLVVDVMLTKAKMGRTGEENLNVMVAEHYKEKRPSYSNNNQRTVMAAPLGVNFADEKQSSQAVGMTGMNRLTSRQSATKKSPAPCRIASEQGQGADARSWHVDYWALSLDQEFSLLTQILAEEDTSSELLVGEPVLVNFFKAVRGAYCSVPYHNFNHAIATMHYTYKFMSSADISRFLTSVDVFAAVMGALCHDIGHRGFSNAFEVMAQSELAVRYNDSSPLENHHCARMFEIAQQGSGAEDCNIFGSFSKETFAIARRRIITGILSTDMMHHGDHVRLMQNFKLQEEVEPNQSQFLVELLMHSADIGNPMMPPAISVKWADRIVAEFSMQAEQESLLGLPVSKHMVGLGDPAAAAKSRLAFIDFVVQPLAEPLFRTFPGLRQAQEHLNMNREALQKEEQPEQ